MKSGRTKRVTRARIQKSTEQEASDSTLEGATTAVSLQISEVYLLHKSPDKQGQEKNQIEESDSEDEAPESVSWSVSKEIAVSERQKEQEIASSAKLKEKQLRQERDEKLKQQRESRRDQKYVRLPADVLEHVAKQQKVVAKEQKLVAKKQKKANLITQQHITFDSDDELVEDETQENEKGDKERGIQVQVLNKQENVKHQGVLDSAKKFLQNHFYGERLNRIDTVKNLALKRKAKHQGPALKFSKSVK